MAEQLISYSFLIFVTALGGGLIPLLFPELHEDRLRIFVALGAGLLLGMAFLHMIPEAAEIIPHAFGFWFLGGFLLLFILERFIMVHPCEEQTCDYHSIGVAAFMGLSVHGLIEGFALASSLYISRLGPLVLVAILAHKAPQGFALTSILQMAGRSKRAILLFAIGVAATAPLGAAAAFSLLYFDDLPKSAGALLAMSGGTFLYIGACHLLPEMHKGNRDRMQRLLAFLGGIAIAAASGFLLDIHHHH